MQDLKLSLKGKVFVLNYLLKENKSFYDFMAKIDFVFFTVMVGFLMVKFLLNIKVAYPILGILVAINLLLLYVNTAFYMDKCEAFSHEYFKKCYRFFAKEDMLTYHMAKDMFPFFDDLEKATLTNALYGFKRGKKMAYYLRMLRVEEL
jgi:hypothetical protein